LYYTDVGCGGTSADGAAVRPPKPPRLASSDQLAAVDSERQTSPRSADAADDGFTPVAVPVTVGLLCSEPDSGLGFDVTGDQTGAVFVRDVFENGPATHAGKIRPGDCDVEAFRGVFYPL